MEADDGKISGDKLYEVLADLIAERKQSCTDAFKLFVKLFTGIVGGATFIATQDHADRVPKYAPISEVLVWVLALVCLGLLYEAKRGWWGYRKAQSRILNDNAPKSYHIPSPRGWQTPLTEIVMGFGIIVAAVLYRCFDPLRAG